MMCLQGSVHDIGILQNFRLMYQTGEQHCFTHPPFLHLYTLTCLDNVQSAWEMSLDSKAASYQSYAAGGRRVLYAGLTPTLVRAFPANAAQWLAWELSRR